MKLSTLFFIIFSMISIGANAHGPTPKKADKSIIINAPIDKVWAVIKHFNNISNWHPDVLSSSGDNKNKSGSERKITLESGVLEEGLDYFSNVDHEYNYRLKTENTDVFPAPCVRIVDVSNFNFRGQKNESKIYRRL